VSAAERAELQALAGQVAALSRKLSCLTGRVTVMGNRLNASDGLISSVAAFKLGLECGERIAAGQLPPLTRRPRHLSAVPPAGASVTPTPGPPAGVSPNGHTAT
jgi:hypothetical protein